MPIDPWRGCWHNYASDFQDAALRDRNDVVAAVGATLSTSAFWFQKLLGNELSCAARVSDQCVAAALANKEGSTCNLDSESSYVRAIYLATRALPRKADAAVNHEAAGGITRQGSRGYLLGAATDRTASVCVPRNRYAAGSARTTSNQDTEHNAQDGNGNSQSDQPPLRRCITGRGRLTAPMASAAR